MEINAEAIRSASAWQQHGEGGSIFFTAKDKHVCAICTEWPDDGILLKAFNRIGATDLRIDSVELIGSEEEIDWQHSAEGLRLSVPKQAPNALGLVYRITTQ